MDPLRNDFTFFTFMCLQQFHFYCFYKTFFFLLMDLFLKGMRALFKIHLRESLDICH